MPHLIEPFRNQSIPQVVGALREAHGFLVARAQTWAAAMPAPGPAWGCTTKRTDVDLTGPSRPAVLNKDSERFAEVVNMVATVERLLGALEWFAAEGGAATLLVAECHPTTSSTPGAPDLTLHDAAGSTVILCEVCDVAAGKAGQNGKESKALVALGCMPEPPADAVRRFICTSSEYAQALAAAGRAWGMRSHRYAAHRVGDAADTCLVEVLPLPAGAAPAHGR